MSGGFLIRGSLRPQMGTIQGASRGISNTTTSPKQPNRIPPSVTIKRNPGTR